MVVAATDSLTEAQLYRCDVFKLVCMASIHKSTSLWLSSCTAKAEVTCG